MIKDMNNKGFTLVELLATIIVTSILTMILMQMLIITVSARVDLETKNRYQNESYIIVEQIRDQIFDLEPQKVELISDTNEQTIIEISHLNDYTTNASDQIIELPNLIVKRLVLDKANGNIYFDGEQINKTSVSLGENSSLTLISIDSTCDFSNALPCEEGMLEITLEIEIILSDNSTLSPRTYVSTILI